MRALRVALFVLFGALLGTAVFWGAVRVGFGIGALLGTEHTPGMQRLLLQAAVLKGLVYGGLSGAILDTLLFPSRRQGSG